MTHHDELRRLYLIERKSIRAIATAQGTTYRQVRAALVAAGVTLRPRGPTRDIPRSAIPESQLAILRRDAVALGVPQAARLHRTSAERLHAILGDQPISRGQKRRVDDHLVRRVYDARLRAGERAGQVVRELARQHQVDQSTIRRSLRRSSVRPA